MAGKICEQQEITDEMHEQAQKMADELGLNDFDSECPTSPTGHHVWRQYFKTENRMSSDYLTEDGFYCIHCLEQHE